ncbi:MAG: ATP-binding cassette domain-containing protein [Clostridiales bacterium]|nr:ATP-binding cassette domain-containing protein [Clostridiales bacterium]
MTKLQLVNMSKSYTSGETVVALQNVSLSFRENELVSILGPSGCGKTTMLNLIGGLDRYDSGDLIINGVSTKEFKDADWDAYRNRSIGFVFQNYNLIGHQTVLQNVEIAMTLSGVSAKERRQRAIKTLTEVGLLDKIHKKPNQLSGGQMQRVAIARALVNNPDIILADEPTGALDSETSVQIMEILKEISQKRLVIMVTHNAELAKQYSSRIVQLLDGKLISDSNPLVPTKVQKMEKRRLERTSMSFLTAAVLSYKNLLTKKGRTLITSFAGSIGIIGVALVLALSTGLSGFMSQVQEDSLSGLPITITEHTETIEHGSNRHDGDGFASLTKKDEEGKFTDENIIYNYDRNANTIEHTNVFTQEYFDYVANIQTVIPDAISAVAYSQGVQANLLAQGENSVVKYSSSNSQSEGGESEEGHGDSGLYWQEMADNEDLILSLYDLIGEGSRLPKKANEILLVVDEYNRIDTQFFEKLGIRSNQDSYKLTDFIGKTVLKVISNDDFYQKDENGLFSEVPVSEYENLYHSNKGMELTIVGVLRAKETANTVVDYLSPGLIYTTELTNYIVSQAEQSEIAIAQKNSDQDVILNVPFANDAAKKQALLRLGADTTPTAINIYPKDYEGKDAIKEYLDEYNTGRPEEEQMVYSDIAQIVESVFGSILNTVTYVLVGFAAISLIVSTIMIAIITYVSVIERTKEIGILRSVGARKKDISRVFNAEAVIIGLTAGVIGVGLSYLLTIPINMIINSLIGVNGIAHLTILHSILLIVGSMTLTLIAGFIPSRMAAKKDPVVALRTE